MNRISVRYRIIPGQVNGQRNVCFDPFVIVCIDSGDCIPSALPDNIGILQPKVAVAIIVDIVIVFV